MSRTVSHAGRVTRHLIGRRIRRQQLDVTHDRIERRTNIVGDRQQQPLPGLHQVLRLAPGLLKGLFITFVFIYIAEYQSNEKKHYAQRTQRDPQHGLSRTLERPVASTDLVERCPDVFVVHLLQKQRSPIVDRLIDQHQRMLLLPDSLRSPVAPSGR